MDVKDETIGQRDYLSVLQALTDAVTPEGVQAIVKFVSSLGEMADAINNPDVLSLLKAVGEHAAQLTRIVSRVAIMEETGQIERVVQILSLVASAQDAMTPEIIAGLIRTVTVVGEIGDRVLQTGLIEKVPDVLDEVQQVLDQPPRASGGPVRRVMTAMRDKDTRAGLEVVLELLRRFGESLDTKVQGGNVNGR